MEFNHRLQEKQGAIDSTGQVSPAVDTSDKVNKQREHKITVRKEFQFADRKMFEISQYLGGSKEGVQLLYDLNTSTRPKYLSYYEKGAHIWGVFPSADVDYTLENGEFLKGVTMGIDSVVLRAPFDSTTIWYEGTFVRVNGVPTPMGTHRVYDEQGVLRMKVEYDSSRAIEGIGRKHPKSIVRIQYNQ